MGVGPSHVQQQEPPADSDEQTESQQNTSNQGGDGGNEDEEEEEEDSVKTTLDPNRKHKHKTPDAEEVKNCRRERKQRHQRIRISTKRPV